MIVNGMQQQITAYYQMNTTNTSFLNVHYYLKQKGIQKNKFFLVIYDPGLIGVNPRDERLNVNMKRRILRECIQNYWYFIREVVRVPDQGGTVGGGKQYQLHRGNLAMNFGFMMNWNMFVEFPRQHGKTIGACIWYLWIYNFGTTNSEVMFMNKRHADSKMNLRRMKSIRDALPSYLRLKEYVDPSGKTIKERNNEESMENVFNHNRITAKAGARNKSSANSVGRGCTMPLHWYDEYAFILFNKEIYMAATPAFTTASKNAKENGAPYGILITTTPGDTTTEEGIEAKDTKDMATVWQEEFYDYDYAKLEKVRNSNESSTFFYIRYSYEQLGSGKEYFTRMVKEMKKDWPAIRREVLLEWSACATNSPFRQQDLDEIGGLITKEPIAKIALCNGLYFLNVYKQMDATTQKKYPPIIGVDVSGGYQKDSSALTVIDSKTTEVVADFNCNYIPITDMTKVVYELVTKYMPNAIVNIERNGGFGASILASLVKSKIKANLYYEVKERIIEEQYNGFKRMNKKAKIRVYGFDETRDSRNHLMEILRDRVDNHKAKFTSPIIYEELKTLEMKKNGRIEHANNAHDDQVFSMLMALYVWYEGQDLMERYGLEKSVIATDSAEEVMEGIDEVYYDIIHDLENSDNEMLNEQMEWINSTKTMSYREWELAEEKANIEAFHQLMRSPKAREAYAREHCGVADDFDEGSAWVRLPSSLFVETEAPQMTELQRTFLNLNDLR